MHEFIEWCGFIGGWLLVAGPIFQASNELREEEFERDAIAVTASNVPPEPAISGWWWLLPPVYWLLSRARRQRQRQSVFEALTVQQREQFAAFMAKAFGWIMVASGAFFIAVKETYEFVEVYHWPLAVFWILVVVMPILAFGYTAASALRARRMIDPDFRPQRGPRVGHRGDPAS